jgi:hypothetical protein
VKMEMLKCLGGAVVFSPKVEFVCQRFVWREMVSKVCWFSLCENVVFGNGFRFFFLRFVVFSVFFFCARIQNEKTRCSFLPLK